MDFGADSAIEAADVVIMTDEPSKIVDAIQLSKKTMRIVKENIIFAIFIKVLVLILSAIGISTMWEAVFADVGTTLITIFPVTFVIVTVPLAYVKLALLLFIVTSII